MQPSSARDFAIASFVNSMNSPTFSGLMNFWAVMILMHDLVCAAPSVSAEDALRLSPQHEFNIRQDVINAERRKSFFIIHVIYCYGTKFSVIFKNTYLVAEVEYREEWPLPVRINIFECNAYRNDL